MKTVHGPEAHVTKKQRGDAPPKPHPPKGNGENEAHTKHARGRSDGSVEANSTTRGVEDCQHVKSIKTENTVVRIVSFVLNILLHHLRKFCQGF